MAISDGKKRISVTLPDDGLEVIREEAKLLNLTVSQYIYLTMMANSFLVDGRKGDLAVNQLQVMREIAWGYKPSDAQMNAPKLV